MSLRRTIRSAATSSLLDKNIRELIGPDRMLHAQVSTRDTDMIIREAVTLRDKVGGNFYVKIPAIPESLKAMPTLRREGVKVTATAIFATGQAMLFARAGADFVAPYVSRLDNIGADGVDVVEEIMHDFQQYDEIKTGVLAASFRTADQIRRLAEENLGITLSLSLHASNDEIRRQIMPIARRWPLGEVMAAVREYVKKTGRRVVFEYALIDQLNSRPEHAVELAALLRDLQCHVNLIPVNPIRERSFRSFRKDVERFQRELTGLGINATIRRTLGSDIQAACGQLRRDADQQKQTAAQTVKNESGNTLFGGGKN